MEASVAASSGGVAAITDLGTSPFVEPLEAQGRADDDPRHATIHEDAGAHAGGGW
jgi:hypothetical protein